MRPLKAMKDWFDKPDGKNDAGAFRLIILVCVSAFMLILLGAWVLG